MPDSIISAPKQALSTAPATTVRQSILNALRYIARTDTRRPGDNPLWDDLMESMRMIEERDPDMLHKPIER